jgi:hypothetical protein
LERPFDNKELPPNFGKAKVGENGFQKNFGRRNFPPQLSRAQDITRNRSGRLLFLLLLDQIHHGIQGGIEGFFEGFADAFYE